MYPDCQILKENVGNPDALFKIIIIGDAGVGKSCILYRATQGTFKENYDVTIGAEYSTFLVKIKGKVVKLQLWDTAGQEGFRSMTRVFYKGSHAVILVYDITKEKSFSKLSGWLEEVKENAPSNVKICLVGNQKDREKYREVSTKDADDFMRKYDLLTLMETSAKTGEGIVGLFVFMAKILFLESQENETAQLEKGYMLENAKEGKRENCC